MELAPTLYSLGIPRTSHPTEMLSPDHPSVLLAIPSHTHTHFCFHIIVTLSSPPANHSAQSLLEPHPFL